MLSAIGRAAIRRIGGFSSLSRVSHARAARNGNHHSSHLKTAGTAHCFSLADRCYATAATKPTTRSSAKKPATKKATSSSKKTKTGSRKPATKKPVKKAKKKVAPKPKKPKKPKTEKQLATLEIAKSRQQIKSLKETALLSEPTPLPVTAWQLLFVEAMSNVSFGGEKATAVAPSSIKTAAAKYRSLDAAQRESYNHTANQNKAANERAYKTWVEGHTPEQIVAANNARKLLAKKAPNLKKRQPIKDSRIPKRPITALLYFYSDRAKSGDLKGITAVEATKRVTAEWNSLSTAEQKTYLDRAAADSLRYQQEVKTVLNRDIVLRTKTVA